MIGRIGLFANDVIMIGSVRADWPAPFSGTIGNPRADKLGMASNVSYRVVQLTEKDVSGQRGQRLGIALSRIAVQVCTMLHLQRWLECRGIKRSGTKSLFMIISHNCQSYVCSRQYVIT